LSLADRSPLFSQEPDQLLDLVNELGLGRLASCFGPLPSGRVVAYASLEMAEAHQPDVGRKVTVAQPGAGLFGVDDNLQTLGR
jgi:hypothetical protein